VGRNSSVGIATRYGLDGPGIESRWERDFPKRPDRPLDLPSLLYNGYRVFPEGKAPGAWRWPPTPSSAEVKERVELYLYSHYGPSWHVLGWTLHLPLPLYVNMLKMCQGSILFSYSVIKLTEKLFAAAHLNLCIHLVTRCAFSEDSVLNTFILVSDMLLL